MSKQPRPFWPSILIALFIGVLVSNAVQATPPAPRRLLAKKPYKFDYREHNGRIVVRSICDRYSKRSLDYRECRSWALDYFQNKCHQAEQRYKKAGGREKRKQYTLKLKYCNAYRRLP